FWNTGQTEVFKVSASNGCGATSYEFGFKGKNCSAGGGGGGDPCNLFLVSPNPGNTTLQVTVVPHIPAPCDPPPLGQISPQTANEPYSKVPKQQKAFIRRLSLYNSSGQLVLDKTYSSDKLQVQLDIEWQAPGLYLLKITDGNYSETHKVV